MIFGRKKQGRTGRKKKDGREGVSERRKMEENTRNTGILRFIGADL
jgi:hypothetical protein